MRVESTRKRHRPALCEAVAGRQLERWNQQVQIVNAANQRCMRVLRRRTALIGDMHDAGHADIVIVLLRVGMSDKRISSTVKNLRRVAVTVQVSDLRDRGAR